MKIDGKQITTTGYEYTFTNINADHTIYVCFEADSYTINIEKNGNGEIFCDESLLNIGAGENRTLYFKQEDVENIEKVYVNNIQVDLQDNKIVIENITENIEVQVVFKSVSEQSQFGIILAMGAGVFVIFAIIVFVVIRNIKKRTY